MRVMFSLIAAAVLALLMVVAVGGIAFGQPFDGGKALAGSEWRPVELNAQPIENGAPIYMRFAAGGKVSGNAGCNRFFGAYKVEGATLTFSPLAATRKACPEPLMTIERKFLDTLEATHAFERDKAHLILRNAAAEPIMRLAQTDWD